MVLVIDVTEQVRAREELADLTSEHFAILDQLPSSVMVFDNEARLLRLNAAGRQLVGPSFLGTTPEDRRRMGALRHPDTGTILEREEMPSVRAVRGETTDGNYLFHTPEDRDGVIHVRAAPLRRADGKIRGAVVVFTERTKGPPV
jgi:PAS domain-containing protein